MGGWVGGWVGGFDTDLSKGLPAECVEVLGGAHVLYGLSGWVGGWVGG